MKRDIISVLDMQNDLEDILALAQRMKKKEADGPIHSLKGKTMGMIFEKPSLRTRVSFEIGFYQLGGNAIYISPNEVQVGKRESVHDVAKVISRYVDVIMYRAFSNEIMKQLAEHATVPVVNGLDDIEHPCQCAADLLTILEHKGDLKGRKLTYIGDGNNVCNSLLLGCAVVGMDMNVACPEGYEPDPAILDKANSIAAGNSCKMQVVNDPETAVEGADAIYTDTWVSMGDEAQKAERERIFAPYQVNNALLSKAKSDVIVLHCLPAHRGQEITDEVMDGPHSVVFDEAENRMHAQKAILVTILGDPSVYD